MRHFGKSQATLIALALALLASWLLSSCGGARRDPPSVSPAEARSVALAEIAALERPAGISVTAWQRLKAELTRQVSAAEITFGPPTDLRSKVVDISATDDNGLVLDWAYRNSGDYDQNGEVNASDLTPMGPALLKTDVDPLWARWRLADGDGNSEVNISDITPIGSGFRHSVASYQVQHSTSEDGPYSPFATVVLNDAQIGTGEYRKRFTYTNPTAQDGWYRVVPFFAGEYGIPGVAVEFVSTNLPPVAVMSTDKQLGQTPLNISFDASASSDPDGTIELYEYDLDGDGTFEQSGDIVTAEHTFNDVGHYEAILRVTDNRGVQTESEVCVGALNWTYSKLADHARHDINGAINLNGTPECIYTEYEVVNPNFTRHHAWFAAGANSAPQDVSEWNRHEIFPTTDAVNSYFLNSISGKPTVILWVSQPPPSDIVTIKFAFATSALPTSSADWTVCDIMTFDSSQDYVTTFPLEQGQRPAIVMYNTVRDAIEYWKAKIDVPLSSTDWDVSAIESTMSSSIFYGWSGIGAERDGLPVVAYAAPWDNELHYAYASVEQPTSPADWTACVVAQGSPWYGLHGLVVCNGIPTMIYEHQPITPGPLVCHFAGAITEAPLTPSHWLGGDLPELNSLSGPIIDYGGHPMFCGRREAYGEPWYYLGCTSNPQTVSEWATGQIAHPIVDEDYCGYSGLGVTSSGASNYFQNQNNDTQSSELWYGQCPLP